MLVKFKFFALADGSFVYVRTDDDAGQTAGMAPDVATLAASLSQELGNVDTAELTVRTKDV